MTPATPPESEAVTAAVPSPKVKVTVPVGTPAPGGVGDTVAVKVTGRPVTEGSGEELTVVNVVAALTATVWTSVVVTGAKSSSPW
ncbi:hypothetical protein BG653_05644 [Streptomyces platensis]|uniref:Uncharacterized protein n=1 Tax=Streptomyces platensis TaxID=58346 RepID=A0ABX3XRN5_STRPT|nr:hypothetical protein BG653_05644 [Streptomyces platensis]